MVVVLKLVLPVATHSVVETGHASMNVSELHCIMHLFVAPFHWHSDGYTLHCACVVTIGHC